MLYGLSLRKSPCGCKSFYRIPERVCYTDPVP
ncbi:MAG: hypothetical protein M2R46_01530 [Verrucomicrobia subdivision 3 bacterium]|nr:hypothetical protein [Limisphaerales bacterium]